MSKIDKSTYTKAEWHKLRQERRERKSNHKIAFVLGNGISRSKIDLTELKPLGKIYGCNALYREFTPDYLVAVDPRMVKEITNAEYQLSNPVWTNYTPLYDKIENLNYFEPMRGWSSGPSALWLAAQHSYDKIYILGFDYSGIGKTNRLNNIYADTLNYKKSSEEATFYGNWLRQTQHILREYPKILFYRITAPSVLDPIELKSFSNLRSLSINSFMDLFDLSFI